MRLPHLQMHCWWFQVFLICSTCCWIMFCALSSFNHLTRWQRLPLFSLMTSEVEKEIFGPTADAAAPFCFNVQSSQWPLYGNVTCILLSSFYLPLKIKGHAHQLLSCFAISLTPLNMFINHVSQKLTLIKSKNNLIYMLFKSLNHQLSVCCIFCFLPACQKGLQMVRKHENCLKAAKMRPEWVCFWTKPNVLGWIAAHLLIELCLMFVLCL